jgi:uncharacterized RDD family membrane protein YckC
MYQPDHSLGEGVYYRKADHARIARRLVSDVVDAIVLLFAVMVVGTVCTAMMGPTDRAVMWIMIIWPAICYIYLVILKPSKVRSLGYIVADLKIVTIKGHRPSLPRMTFRLGLAFLGSWFIPPLELIWVGIDDDSQTLRDRYASTYVVRARAEPVGRGSIHLTRYMALGWNLMFPVVTRPPADKSV